MYHRLISIIGAVAVALCGQSALAASVSLNPASSTVTAGETFDLGLFLDARDVRGAHPGEFCGVITVDFDSSLTTFAGAASIFTDVVEGTSDDGRSTITFSFDEFTFSNTASDEGLVGTLTFQATSELDTATFGVADGDPLGSFANHAPGTARSLIALNEFFPNFNPAQVTVEAPVPVPAAAWLFLSAVGSLGLARRKTGNAH